MSKEIGIVTKYKNGELPAGLIELVTKADETDLAILIATLMLSEGGKAVFPSELSEKLSLDKKEVSASLKFWRGAGIIENADAVKSESAPAKTEAKKETAIKTAHRDGAIEKSNVMKPYSTDELASIMETKVVSPQLIDEAQRIMGKMFRTYDIEILVGLVDRLGFDEEAVLHILNYVACNGKKTMRYAETVAMMLHDDVGTETAEVIARIERMQNSKEVISKIRGLYGMGDRALTTSEKRIFGVWTENYGYDIEVIRMAYDITVDVTHKPTVKYTNGILERWYSEGVRNAEDAKSFIERQKTDKNGNSPAKSYDTDDFFEAALKRSYEEFSKL